MKKIIGSIIVITLFVVGLAYAIQTVDILPLMLGIKSTTTTVADTATAIPTTALKGRKSIAIRNNQAATVIVYIGGSDVTTANGFPLDSTCPSITIDADDAIVVYGIVASGTGNVRAIEAK